MPQDPDICQVRWCDERADHAGPHRGIEFDVNGYDLGAGRPVVLQAVRQGESARVSACVLVCQAIEVGLTWPQTRALAATLDKMAASQL